MLTTRISRLARLAGAGIGLVALGASLFSVGATAEPDGAYASYRPGEERVGMRASNPWVRTLTGHNLTANSWVDASEGNASVTFSEAFGGTRHQAGTVQDPAQPGAMVLTSDVTTTSGPHLASANWIIDVAKDPDDPANNSNGYAEDYFAESNVKLSEVRHLQYDQRADMSKVNLKLEVRLNDPAGPANQAGNDAPEGVGPTGPQPGADACWNNTPSPSNTSMQDCQDAYQGSGSRYATAVYSSTLGLPTAVADRAGWERLDATHLTAQAWQLTNTTGSDCDHNSADFCTFGEIQAELGDANVVSVQLGLGSTSGTNAVADTGVVDNLVYRFGSANRGDFKAWNMETHAYPTPQTPKVIDDARMRVLNKGVTVTHSGNFGFGTDAAGTPLTEFKARLTDLDNNPIADAKVNFLRVEQMPGFPKTFLCDALTDEFGYAMCGYDGGSDPTFTDVTVQAVWADQPRDPSRQGGYVVHGTTATLEYFTY